MFIEQFFEPNSMKAISELYEVISMEQVDKFNKDMDVVEKFIIHNAHVLTLIFQAKST